MMQMRRVAVAILGMTMLASAIGPLPASASAAWVIFVDDLHFNFRHTGRLRDLVRTVLAQIVRPEDLVTLRASGPSAVGGDLGSRDFYRPRVSRVTGNGLSEEDLLRTDSAALAEVQMRFSRAMSAAVDAIDAFKSAGDAPRGLILISNGYARDVLATPEGKALIDATVRNSVRLFAISGRYIDSELPPAANADVWPAHLETTRNSLRDLAESTGGFAILTARELPAALQRIRVE
jgi:hypothetical protein